MSTATWSRDKVVSVSEPGKLTFITVSATYGSDGDRDYFSNYTTEYMDSDFTSLSAAQIKAKGKFNDKSAFGKDE